MRFSNHVSSARTKTRCTKASGHTPSLAGVFRGNHATRASVEKAQISNFLCQQCASIEECQNLLFRFQANSVTVSVAKSKRSSASSLVRPKQKGPKPEETLPGNQQQNKARKKDFKRLKKERKRAGMRSSHLLNGTTDPRKQVTSPISLPTDATKILKFVAIYCCR